MNITRDESISKLINDEIDTIMESLIYNDYSYLENMLNIGFKGYQNFTNEELEFEINERLNYQIHKFKIINDENP